MTTKYRYHVLRDWATYPNHKNGLYEVWIVLTEEEFEDYERNPPNHDKLVKILDKEEIK